MESDPGFGAAPGGDDELVEKVAIDLWSVISPDLKPELRVQIWNGQHEIADDFLSDDDFQNMGEDEDGQPMVKVFMCPLGRNTLRSLARAALSVARQSIREECAQVAEKCGEEYFSYNANAAATEIAAAIRAME